MRVCVIDESSVHIELPAKLLDYVFGNNKSNINQWVMSPCAFVSGWGECVSLSHVTHVNESWTKACMSYSNLTCLICNIHGRVCIVQSCHIYGWVMSHMWMTPHTSSPTYLWRLFCNLISFPDTKNTLQHICSTHCNILQRTWFVGWCISWCVFILGSLSICPLLACITRMHTQTHHTPAQTHTHSLTHTHTHKHTHTHTHPHTYAHQYVCVKIACEDMGKWKLIGLPDSQYKKCVWECVRVCVWVDVCVCVCVRVSVYLSVCACADVSLSVYVCVSDQSTYSNRGTQTICLGVCVC